MVSEEFWVARSVLSHGVLYYQHEDVSIMRPRDSRIGAKHAPKVGTAIYKSACMSPSSEPYEILQFSRVERVSTGKAVRLCFSKTLNVCGNTFVLFLMVKSVL